MKRYGPRPQQVPRSRGAAFSPRASRSRGGMGSRARGPQRPFSPMRDPWGRPLTPEKPRRVRPLAWLWSTRRGTAPIFASVSLWCLGALSLALGVAMTTTIAVAVVLGAVLGWWMSKAKKSRAFQNYAWALFLFVTGWESAATTVSVWPGSIPSGWMCVSLLSAFCVFSPFWWRHYRVRTTKKGEETRIWEERVACSGGALPGSMLTDVKHGKDGWTAVVVLPGGFEDSEGAMRAQKRIASAYASAYSKRQSISISSVTLEATADQRADLLRLTVFKENPTHEKTLYSDAQYELVDGCVPIMLFPDRMRGYFRIFQPGSGSSHALVAGDNGTGKSRTVDMILTQSNRTGLVQTWFADPQGGNSSRAWAGKKGKARWVARTPEQIVEMITAAHRVMMARSRANNDMTWVNEDGEEEIGVDWFDPSPERPIIQLVIEEAYNVFAWPGMGKLLEDLAKMGRKCGIQLILVVQWPGLDQINDSNALRAQLKAGTIISMRIAEPMGGNILFSQHLASFASPNGIPRTFPNGQPTMGMAVLEGSGPGSSRAVYGRVFTQENEAGRSISTRWANIVAQLAPDLEPVAAEAAGPDYQHYIRHGVWPETKAPRESVVSMSKAPSPGAPDAASGTLKDRILQVLRDPQKVAVLGMEGAIRLSKISDELGVEKNRAWNELNKLKSAGVVDVTEGGYYYLTRSGVPV